MGRNIGNITLTVAALFITASCQKKSEDASTTSTAKTLYVASGQCTSGGITTYTGTATSRMILKLDASSGAEKGVFMDFNSTLLSTGTQPQKMIDRGDSILLLTENATNMGDRRILSIPKDDATKFTTYFNDNTAFTATAAHILRSFAMDDDGGIIVSKTVGVEKVSSSLVRLSMAGNSWVNSPGGTVCTFGATPDVSAIAVMKPYNDGTISKSAGKIIFAHKGATAATNRIGVVSADGYVASADCTGGFGNLASGDVSVTIPYATGVSGVGGVNATRRPASGDQTTAMIYIPTPSAAAPTVGKLLIAKSSSGSIATALNNNTFFQHGIIIMDVNESRHTSSTATAADGVTFTNPKVIWNKWDVLFGISAMAYDADTRSLYVATAPEPGLANQSTNNRGYHIEKFTLDLDAPSMTRVGTTPFYRGNVNTKCISDIMISDK